MKTIVATLFIALSVFRNSVESSGGSSSGRSQSPPPEINLFVTDKPPEWLYYEDANGNLESLSYSSAIFELGKYLIGLILGGTRVVPLFNKKHQLVWQDRLNRDDQIVISRELAREFGMPGSIQGVSAAMGRNKEMYRVIVRQAVENKRKRAAENERERAAENEHKRAAENQLRQDIENQGKPSRSSEKYEETRGD